MYLFIDSFSLFIRTVCRLELGVEIGKVICRHQGYHVDRNLARIVFHTILRTLKLYRQFSRSEELYAEDPHTDLK